MCATAVYPFSKHVSVERFEHQVSGDDYHVEHKVLPALLIHVSKESWRSNFNGKGCSAVRLLSFAA